MDQEITLALGLIDPNKQQNIFYNLLKDKLLNKWVPTEDEFYEVMVYVARKGHTATSISSLILDYYPLNIKIIKTYCKYIPIEYIISSNIQIPQDVLDEIVTKKKDNNTELFKLIENYPFKFKYKNYYNISVVNYMNFLKIINKNNIPPTEKELVKLSDIRVLNDNGDTLTELFEYLISLMISNESTILSNPRRIDRIDVKYILNNTKGYMCEVIRKILDNKNLI